MSNPQETINKLFPSLKAEPELAELRSNQWIAVCERLPEIEKDVLWQRPNGLYFIGHRVSGHLVGDDDGLADYVENFVAWQNLPAPYEEGK